MNEEEPVKSKKPFKIKLSDLKNSEAVKRTEHINRASAAPEHLNRPRHPGPADCLQHMEEERFRISDLMKPSLDRNEKEA
ncbi:hypothetical protein [Sinorhizobium sojae]|uniref:hypothetical protein n=1 Tax=Sinorhizobium sojae TaxID=716925 RepID=UPI0012FA67AB|nr:hypothetical protein [Sinorhizobium sojae]